MTILHVFHIKKSSFKLKDAGRKMKVYEKEFTKKNSSSFYLMNIYQGVILRDLSFIVYKDSMK